MSVFCIHFQFFLGPTIKKLVWLYICIQFSFLVLKKMWNKYNNWIQLLVFSFSWKWIQWHFCKNIKYVSSTITDLSHQRTDPLSLSLLVGCQKKSEGEDKVENDAKQKNRWKQKISTRFEYRKWVEKMKIENEYNLNTNQTSPKLP